MGYLHILNVYADKTIFMFKECFALEKINGSSGHIQYKVETNTIHFHGPGVSNEVFVSLFPTNIKDKLAEFGTDIIIHGENYGGKMQAMSATYGKAPKFIAFDVLLDGKWQDVPTAEKIVTDLGLEFVYYKKITTDLYNINAERDADSTQAIRNGMGNGHKREGVILRPIVEMSLATGDRVIYKHKRDEFRETASPRIISDDQLQVLKDAEAIALEWVTTTRMQHVLDKIPGHNTSQLKAIIDAMIEDVLREGKNEIVDSKEARKAISQRTVSLYKGLK